MSRILMSATLALLIAPLLALAADPAILRVGIMESLTLGTSPRVRESLAPKFAELVKDFTGYKSVTLQGLSPFTAARQLEAGKWHLGIFQGVELAWVQGRYPKLKPLMVAIFEEANVRAVLMVKKDSNVDGFKGLQGRTVCIHETKLHCSLFADKGAGGRAQDFFGKLLQVGSGEDALDDILLGKAEAAVVDTAILKLYKDVNPGRYKQLKIAAKSEVFPSPAVVYRQGTLSDDMLKKLRAGMLKANQSEKGREVMTTFQITSFQPVPKDYQQTLANIAKAYPAPPE
jgi:ABC-type phosphate/phosphonate transport system substrate-binding protein